MIVRIEPSGRSFRGAGEYYLHDKAADRSMAKDLKPDTDERVWFTEVRNCASLDPAEALDEMWMTAESQQWLKQANGISTAGRVCTDPVKTIALAWHKDDRPTPEMMARAAHAYLEEMGWGEHQAVMIGHRDTEHRHVHIILNRVHPETGKVLDDWHDHPRSQTWALAYEKEHGKLWCEEREINAAKREKRAPDLSKAADRSQEPANQYMPYHVHALFKPGEKQHQANEAARLSSPADEKEMLKADQKAERLAWFDEGRSLFRQARHGVYAAVRAEFRDEWKDLYRERTAATKRADAHSKNALARALHFAGQGEWEKAIGAFGDRNAEFVDVVDSYAERLSDLKARRTATIKERSDEMIAKLKAERDIAYKDLLARQQGERDTMRAAHAQGRSGEFVLDMRQNVASLDAFQRGSDPAAIAREAPHSNDNRQPEPAAAKPQPSLAAFKEKSPDAAAKPARSPEPKPHPRPNVLVSGRQNNRGTVVNQGRPANDPTMRPAAKGPADLAAGSIGAVADYIADALGELFAPTPREDQQQKGPAMQENEPAPAVPENDEVQAWNRYINGLVHQVQQEAEQKRSDDYWNDRRETTKDRDRDR